MAKRRRNPDKIKESGRRLEIGDVFYLMGSNTKVKIVGKVETTDPECEILEASASSKFTPGQVTRIFNQVLYPNKGKSKKSNHGGL